MRRFGQPSYCVSLPPPLSYTGLLFSCVNKSQNFTSPALNGAHQAFCEPYFTRAWKSPTFSSHTSLFSHEMTPLFNQLWIMKFCTRDPFSLHLTVIELHSHAISFTKPMRREGSGGGAVHCVMCAYVFERWRWFPCDIMGPCSMALQQRVPSVHWDHVVPQHSVLLQLQGCKGGMCACMCIHHIRTELHTNRLQKPGVKSKTKGIKRWQWENKCGWGWGRLSKIRPERKSKK